MNRDIFAEIVEGFDALEAERNDQISLRRHPFETEATSTLKPADVPVIHKRDKQTRAG